MKLTDSLFFYPERGMPGCNTCVIIGEVSLIIDVGFENQLEALIKLMHRDGIEPEDIDLILNTHLHLDHCWANQAFKDISGAKIALHPIQVEYLHFSLVEMPKHFAAFINMLGQPKQFKEDTILGDKLDTGNLELDLLLAPGHSPDSICFYSKEEKFLICGDVVFDQSTGRVDFPGGDASVLKRSIEELSKLDIAYLLPGHMNFVKGEEAVKSNFEFVRQYVFPWLY